MAEAGVDGDPRQGSRVRRIGHRQQVLGQFHEPFQRGSLAHYYDTPEAVEDYERVMNHLRHLALNPKRSRALVAAMRKELQ